MNGCKSNTKLTHLTHWEQPGEQEVLILWQCSRLMQVLMQVTIQLQLLTLTLMEILSFQEIDYTTTAATNLRTATVSQVSTDQTKDGVTQSTEVNWW